MLFPGLFTEPLQHVGLDRQISLVKGVGGFRRDLPRWNRSLACLDIVDALPKKLRAKLGEHHRRLPHAAHCAVAAIDAGLIEPGLRLSLGRRPFGTPRIDLHTLRRAYAEHGAKAVDQAVRWFARELYARTLCYGTQGICPRRAFLTEIAEYREVMGGTYQPPEFVTDIIATLMSTGVIVPRWRHHSGGQTYPTYSFNQG